MKWRVVIATISLARNKKEEKIILNTLTELNKLGLPIILTDESASAFPIFYKIKGLKNIRAFKANGLDAKIKRSLSEASRIGQFIFYTESDKLDFVSKHAPNFIQKFLKSPQGVWLSARSEKSFDRYPKYQKIVEKFLWQSSWALFDGKTMDISYGPRIFPSSLVKYIKSIRGKIGFGWQAYLLTVGFRLGLPITEVVFDVNPPADIQKGRRAILYRMWQAEDHLKGFAQGLKIKL